MDFRINGSGRLQPPTQRAGATAPLGPTAPQARRATGDTANLSAAARPDATAAAPVAADPAQAKAALGAFMKDYEKAMADGELGPEERQALETSAKNLPNADFRTWATNALALVAANSNKRSDGSLIPKNEVVQHMIDSTQLDLVATRIDQANHHPLLDTIKDPAAREQMREFMTRYMADPAFMAVHNSRISNWGPLTNLFQTWAGIRGKHDIGSGAIDDKFGGCVECTARMHAIFEQFKADWSQRPENRGKPFLLQDGHIQTQNVVGFEHNFSCVRTATGQTLYFDPWHAQETNKDTIMTKGSYLDGMKKGLLHTGLGQGDVTWVTEDGREVYNPGMSNTAVIQ